MKKQKCTKAQWMKLGQMLSVAFASFTLLAVPTTYDGLSSVTDPTDPTNGGFWDLSETTGIAVDEQCAVSTTPFATICQFVAPIMTSVGFFETSCRYRGESPAIGINTRPVTGVMIIFR